MDVITLVQSLIAKKSITPHDAGCQDLIKEFLNPLGFQCETLIFEDVTNLWARKGQHEPLLVFLGHTDVVPEGPIEKWQSPPFTPTIRNGFLYGRGAADMKSSIAAMMIAIRDFVQLYPHFKGSIGFLITSDEEGPSLNGTRKVVEWLERQQISITSCLVGEASSQTALGDTIKIGRRGSLHAAIEFSGKQGHVAYPQLAANAVHLALTPLAQLAETVWDNGNEHFPPTTMQIVNVKAGTGASNVIPGELQAQINWRFNTCYTASSLQQKILSILNATQVPFQCRFTVGAEPFLSTPHRLTAAIESSTQKLLQRSPELSTSGGTSDGRFIAPLGVEVVELGPCNATIHQIDERIDLQELTELTKLYLEILKAYFL